MNKINKDLYNGILIVGLFIFAIIFVIVGVIFHKKRTTKY